MVSELKMLWLTGNSHAAAHAGLTNPDAERKCHFPEENQKNVLDRRGKRCYNAPRGDSPTSDLYGPLAQLVRASGS